MTTQPKTPAKPNSAYLKEQLTAATEAISAKLTLRGTLADELDRTIASAPVGDIAVARLRKQLSGLDAELADLQDTRKVLTAHFNDAVARELSERWAAKNADHAKAGKALLDKVGELQQQYDEAIRGLDAIRVDFLKWYAEAPRKSQEADDMSAPALLWPRLQLRSFALTQGAFRVPNVIENPYELMTAGRVDIRRMFADWLSVVARNSALPPSISPPIPPDAA